MKNMLFIISLFSTWGFAGEKIPDDALDVYPVIGKVVGSPEVYRVRDGSGIERTQTAVKLMFTLNGCVDRLAGVAFRAHAVGRGEAILFVSATAYARSASKRVSCPSPATQIVTAAMEGSYSQFKLAHLSHIKNLYLDATDFSDEE